MYKIRILLKSDLCAGSGESTGNTVDRDICMDEMGLPYIPARRLKGCFREAAETLHDMGYEHITDTWIVKVFGEPFGTPGSIEIANAYLNGYEEMRTLIKEKRAEHTGLSSVDVLDLFTYTRGQTRLENGVKVDNSLRFTRVLSHYDPLTPQGDRETALYARVYLEDEDVETFRAVCAATRHIGSGRNRGMGNVAISLESMEQEITIEEKNTISGDADENAKVRISYKISLDAPLTLPGYDEMQSVIPARSVIGCMASKYMQQGGDDVHFRELFLNGETIWSDLTPVIGGQRSLPTPLMLVRLKNDNNKMINRYTEHDNEWNKKKPKTMEGSYAVLQDGEIKVIYPETHSEYHVRLSDRDGFGKSLYMQDSLEPFGIYGGEVEVSKKYADTVINLLKKSRLRFGRSRSAQYAACSLLSVDAHDIKAEEMIKTEVGDAVFAILTSDLVIDDGSYQTEESIVRAHIAASLGIEDVSTEEYKDQCRYRVISGYQTMWQMNKPHIPAVCAGSVYCFTANGKALPREIVVGEFRQEGFGKIRVSTLREMEKLRICEHLAEADRFQSVKHTEIEKQFEAVLLRKIALEEIKQYAEEKWKNEIAANIKKGSGKNALPIGRLRAMLKDADSIQDLRKRIEDIKESDLSSEILISRKADCMRVVDILYGKNDKEWLDSLSLKIGANNLAMQMVEAEWKRMLYSVLHNAHYRKGDQRA